MKKIVFAVMLAALSAGALAAELADVTVEDRVQVGGKELVLNGLGLREKFWVDVYVGALYLPEKTPKADAAMAMEGPVRMSMHFVHDAPAEKIIEGWQEGFQGNNAKADLDALGQRLDKFYQFFAQDIKEGDLVVLDFIPGQGTEVSINGEVKGTVEGADFSKALRAVWLGPKPPSKSFRKGLLGN